MTTQGLFSEELEKALATMPEGFADAILLNLYPCDVSYYPNRFMRAAAMF